MKLSTLLQGIYPLPPTADRKINHIVLDSRQIQPNDLFCALKGSATDGRKFIPQAIAQGASVILCEHEKNKKNTSYQENETLIIPLPQLREQLGELAARFYQYPAKKLKVFGVTGTNGKTSCTHYLAQLLEDANITAGIIGTLGAGRYNQLNFFGLTTPDTITLQATLNDFIQQQIRAVCMEVSSHSIDQHRIAAIDFNVGIFTNLSQDHLDYHGSMAQYAAVKKQFIAANTTQIGVINIDDSYGRQWANELSQRKPIYGFGFKSNSYPSQIPVTTATQIEMSLAGISAKIISPWGEGDFNSTLIGDFNLSNILATVTALCASGMPFADVLARVAELKAVAGRMQTLGGGQKPLAVVDYSHTPDALEKALKALRENTAGQLICVFGCGGNRDKGKRPQMAEVAEHYADIVILTNDNPRDERPEAIAVDIMHGFARPERVIIELNRAKAIQKSIQLAQAEDCILIAGKGAEHYQIIGNEKIPFDDAETVQKFL